MGHDHDEDIRPAAEAPEAWTDAMVQAVRGLGREAMAIAAELSDRRAVDAMYAQVEKAWGRLDIFVANAGIWPEEDVAVADMAEILAESLAPQISSAGWAENPMLRQTVKQKIERFLRALKVERTRLQPIMERILDHLIHLPSTAAPASAPPPPRKTPAR